ncbi:J domain-containing protein [Bradyrhizobium sp.]|uniref:J domain-containing protein n=1 Tax=Bradyrhizobium sp. TaxID=376 RepID=UPI003C586085
MGIRPDADAEAVKQAFRKAAKLHHPDHHPGDPDAASRFRRIAAAYAILRDAGRRASYDRRLARERRRVRSTWMRMIAADAICVVLLVMLFVWMDPILSTSLRTHKIDSGVARGASEIAAAPTAARSAVQDAAPDKRQHARQETRQDKRQDTRQDSPHDRDSRRDSLGPIPDRSLEPSADRLAADDVPDMPRRPPHLRPLPNALGDIPADRSGQVWAAR